MSSDSRDLLATPTTCDHKKCVQACPLTAKIGGFIRVPPRTNINESRDWCANRVILLDMIHENKSLGTRLKRNVVPD